MLDCLGNIISEVGKVARLTLSGRCTYRRDREWWSTRNGLELARNICAESLRWIQVRVDCSSIPSGTDIV